MARAAGLVGFAVGTALAGAGCESPGAVLVHVESELRVPDEVDEIRVAAVAETGERLDRSYPLDAPFPQTLSLRLPGRSGTRIDITVTALLDGRTLVRRVVTALFVAGEDRDVFVCLERACRNVSCADAQVCRAGACVPPPSDDGPPPASCAAPAPGTCGTDADCDDGVFCNGDEGCRAGRCQPSPGRSCDDAVACTVDSCDEAVRACVNRPRDADCADGLACTGDEVCDAVAGCVPGTPVACDDADACTVDSCAEPAGDCAHAPRDDDGDGRRPVACGGDDCDDADEAVYPGAAETCNARDDDCDGFDDDGRFAPVDVPVALERLLDDTTELVEAFDGAGLSVVWTESSGGQSVLVRARLAPDGTLLRAEQTLTPPAGRNFAPALAWSGELYGLAWRRTEGTAETVRFRLYRRTWDAAAAEVELATTAGLPAVAASGTTFGVAWGGTGASFRSVTDAGMPGLAVALPDDPPLPPVTARPAVAGLPGDRFAVAWIVDGAGGNGTGRVAVVAADGTLAAGPADLAGVGADLRAISLAASAAGFLAVWQEQVAGRAAVRGRLFLADGAPVAAPFDVWTADRAYAPIAAPHGSEFGVAWWTDAGGAPDVMFARLRADGARNGDPVRLGAGATATLPHVAGGTSDYRVAMVWELFGQRRTATVAVTCR